MPLSDFLDEDLSIKGSKSRSNDLDLHELSYSLGNELRVPQVERPSHFIRDAFVDVPEKDKLRFAHGTTTLAFAFQGGIIVAVDSRASMGQYVGSGTVKKIIEINPYLLGTMAGGAADCSFWERDLGRRCRLYELRNKERISVAAASKLLANTVYYYRGMGLSMGTMICGWDKTGPNIFYVDSDGTRFKGHIFSVGSGSTFAYGVLDQGYSYDMSVEDAIKLGQKSIYHATHRDAASGGVINCYHVKEDGWVKISSEDMMIQHRARVSERKAEDEASDAAKAAAAQPASA
ncbi:Proteasome subunit beta type-5 [Gracilariopsis chorda]|uniref:Proteasome subunit beta n=1 Tax=Gracilariopsis chorda TaxID=448386 RepID=A0A2V3IU90_9FLOR|nr:Proteasome subunit beta type-5 [Gracilariopsis chorda]|eukprot:PXF45682.1 Proteasome subunit beta type-5 [Gracilariopsis chorda]